MKGAAVRFTCHRAFGGRGTQLVATETRERAPTHHTHRDKARAKATYRSGAAIGAVGRARCKHPLWKRKSAAASAAAFAAAVASAAALAASAAVAASLPPLLSLLPLSLLRLSVFDPQAAAGAERTMPPTRQSRFHGEMSLRAFRRPRCTRSRTSVRLLSVFSFSPIVERIGPAHSGRPLPLALDVAGILATLGQQLDRARVEGVLPLEAAWSLGSREMVEAFLASELLTGALASGSR